MWQCTEPSTLLAHDGCQATAHDGSQAVAHEFSRQMNQDWSRALTCKGADAMADTNKVRNAFEATNVDAEP